MAARAGASNPVGTMLERLRSELARRRADGEQLDHLVDELGEGRSGLTADGNRGHPDVDLGGWAQRRGLEYRGGRPQSGYLNVTCPWSEDILFNVVRGRLPGGEYGVLCHENRLRTYDAEDGRVFGGKILRGRPTVGGTVANVVSGTLDFVAGAGFPTGSVGVVAVPYTVAGVRAAHLGSITGLHVARRFEQPPQDENLMGTWRARGLDELGLPDWRAGIRMHSDTVVVDRLLAGPLAELLRGELPLGFELMIQFGQVRVAQQTYVKRDDLLDRLAEIASWTAAVVSDACAPGHGPIPLELSLEAPAWLPAVRRQMHEANTLWPIGARLETVVQVADERGLEIEDSRAFHRAHPDLNVPGEAFAVLRGRLPGTELTGRLLCCAERKMWIPQEAQRVLTNPGGRVGCDVAVVAVRPDAPATAPEGELEGDLRIAIWDGVLTTWRQRPRWQADGASIDRLAADTAAVVSDRQLMC